MKHTKPLWNALWYVVFLSWGGLFVFILPPVENALLITFLCYFIADAGSYFFHYIVDFYGNPYKEGLVREFQKHHIVPGGIANKSVSEILYPAARMAVPLLAGLWPVAFLGWISETVAYVVFLLVSLWVFTQLFHRWSHKRSQGLIRLLQNVGVLVSPESHARHHQAPYHSHYAVINGWSNWIFDGIRIPFFVDKLLAFFNFKKHELTDSLRELVKIEQEARGTSNQGGMS